MKTTHYCYSIDVVGFQNTIAYTTPKEEVERILPQFDGIVIRSRFPLNASFLAKGSNLKFIARVGAGVENIDQNAAKQCGITLFRLL